MHNDQLVWCTILNFLFRARAIGNINVDIAKAASDFSENEKIMEAKKKLFANCSNRPSDRQKSSENCHDMLKILEKCAERQILLPRFVIYEPDEVYVIPGEMSATLTRKVNELCLKLDNFIQTQRSIMPTPEASLKPPPKLTYAVVLKNPPKELFDPKESRAFIENLCGDSKISIAEIRPGRDMALCRQ